MAPLDARWRTSTRTGPNGACVEVRWVKSSRSGPDGQCVEVRALDGAVEVRDTKDRTGPSLRFTPTGWQTFLAGIKADEFQVS